MITGVPSRLHLSGNLPGWRPYVAKTKRLTRRPERRGETRSRLAPNRSIDELMRRRTYVLTIRSTSSTKTTAPPTCTFTGAEM